VSLGLITDMLFLGHCRRRKIRCLLAPDDPQGRCSNCIRLKKECNFYPVEHNPDMPQSQAILSKSSSSVQPGTPVATSPRHAIPTSGEAMGEFRTSFNGATSSAQPSNFGYQGEPEIDPQHAPTSSGCKFDLVVQVPRAKDCSTRTTSGLPLPSPHRNSVATIEQFPALVHCSRESFMAPLTFDSEFGIRQ
jgi:hypothetical protein